jgi:hypothetical protein
LVNRHIVRALAICAIASVAEPAAAQEPTLAAVLGRAGAYVAEFHRQLSGIVAEERYVQHFYPLTIGQSGPGPAHRELKSDLLLLKPAGADAWMAFRDVFDVDGAPVRDRRERLAQLFLERSPSTDAQMRKILDESARYNIGDIRRNVNTPVYPLLFLDAANQFRFKFKQTKERRPRTEPANGPQAGAFRVSTEVWVIAYEEKEAGTMIKTDGHKDLPAEGRFWIEPATGRVLMSELVARNRRLRSATSRSRWSACWCQSRCGSGTTTCARDRESKPSRRTGSSGSSRSTPAKPFSSRSRGRARLGPKESPQSWPRDRHGRGISRSAW